MDAPWKAERAVDAPLAARLIGAQFAELADADVSPLGEGWDNTVFLVAERWVFRFPRRQVAAALIVHESRCLPAVADRLPLAVPRPTFVGRPTDAFPWTFAGYEHLAGTTACRAPLDSSDRARAAAPLADFLRALHSISAAEATELGAPPDELRRLDLTYRVDQTLERLGASADFFAVELVAGLERALEDTVLEWQPSVRSLCHGDLYARHVLVDDDRSPSAVIDWGDIHVGDGTVDLALAHGFLPPSTHDRFRDRYGPVDDAAWRAARTRAIATNLMVAISGADLRDRALEAEGRRALANIVAAG